MDPIIASAGFAVLFMYLWWRKRKRQEETSETEMTPMEIDDDPMDMVDGYAVDPMQIDSGCDADDEQDGVIISKVLRTIDLFYHKNK
jgi:hypothetical protein